MNLNFYNPNNLGNLQDLQNNLQEQINKLKKDKKAVILAHCYQPVEIDLVADYVGDSLYLSQMAAKTNADIILFAGVYFMAQTAKILNPNRKVLLPRLESGCRMADMISLNQLREFKSKYPDIPTVCYINSTAEVKSECDICCTSSNAIKIVNFDLHYPWLTKNKRQDNLSCLLFLIIRTLR